MVWTSFSALALVDLTIVAMAAAMLAFAWSRGMFQKGATPRAGRVLIAAGVLVTAAYYLADFVAIAILPVFSGEVAALPIIDLLQTRVREVSTLVSIGLIAAGFVFVAAQRRVVEEKMRSASARVRQAEASVTESESRFRALIEQFSDAVYCVEFRPPLDVSLDIGEQIQRSYDAIFVDCNTPFARSLGLKRTAEVVGQRFGDVGVARDRASHEAFFRALVEANYLLADYEQAFHAQDGKRSVLNVHCRGVVEQNGLRTLWASERNVLQMRQTEQALEVRERFQETLARISHRLLTRPHQHSTAAIEASLKDLCHYLDADRATLAWFDRPDGDAEVIHYWAKPGVPPLFLGSADFAAVFPKLGVDEEIEFASSADLTDNAPLDKDVVARAGIKSAAMVPLHVGGESLGCCSLVNLLAERRWTKQDMQDLRVLGELFASSISRLKARETLSDALHQLELAKERLEAENVYLQEEILSTHGFHEIIGESAGLKHCLHQVSQVAQTGTPVLIQGETGTGKELIARAIHDRSERGSRTLVKVNCAALPRDLIESELFGHEAGAFTGAQGRKQGRFDLADGGSLFLDEIGDFPLDLQGKLLRVLQDGEFQRLGGTETIRVDVRIIAATNRRLLDAVEQGEFRSDLYYRINTFTIDLPPLRERDGDVQLLVQHFVNVYGPRLGAGERGLPSALLQQMNGYAWPGNVRELESVVQRALISGEDAQLRPDVLDPASAPEGITRAVSAGSDLNNAEKRHIETVLQQSGWQVSGEQGAAARLGIPASTLRSRMKKLGISRGSKVA
ncbi:MAG: sigma 54-interacting transcriptional regulator [Pseudomonadota bacterium]